MDAEKIITDNVEIFEALEQNDTESGLIDKLITLVRAPEQQAEPEEAVANGAGTLRLMKLPKHQPSKKKPRHPGVNF